VPVLREQAQEAGEDSRLPEASAAALMNAGMIRLSIHRSYSASFLLEVAVYGLLTDCQSITATLVTENVPGCLPPIGSPRGRSARVSAPALVGRIYLSAGDFRTIHRADAKERTAMEFGLALPQGAHNDLRRDVARVAREAEAAGFNSLWALERVLFPLNPADGLYGIEGLPWSPYYEYCADPLTVLTVAGAVTERIRLGTCVLIAPLHNKLLLARTLATLDQVTGGRMTVGFGGGWSTDEYAAAGADFASRGQAFDEMIDALRALFGPNPVSYRDSRITVDNALVSPKPVAELPILIGGGWSKRALRRIAEKGDGWMPVDMPGQDLASTWKQILDLAESAGRDPRALRLLDMVNPIVTDKPAGADRQVFHGTPEQLMEDFTAIAEAGAHELIIGLDGSAANAGELLDKAALLLDAAESAGLGHTAGRRR
jgi:probable F420-dependent oxidoreductase